MTWRLHILKISVIFILFFLLFVNWKIPPVLSARCYTFHGGINAPCDRLCLYRNIHLLYRAWHERKKKNLKNSYAECVGMAVKSPPTKILKSKFPPICFKHLCISEPRSLAPLHNLRIPYNRKVLLLCGGDIWDVVIPDGWEQFAWGWTIGLYIDNSTCSSPGRIWDGKFVRVGCAKTSSIIYNPVYTVELIYILIWFPHMHPPLLFVYTAGSSK